MRRWFNVLPLASIGALAALSLAATLSATSPTSLEDELLRDATLVFRRAVELPAAAIPTSIMMRSRAVAVIPAAAKRDGTYSGVGVVSARGVNTESWTPPAVIVFQGTTPFELETETLDFVLVAQTWRGLEYLTQERFAGPVICPIQPGPLEESSSVGMTADLLAYAQLGEYFAGVSIDNWTITELQSANKKLYGRPYSTDDIVRGAGFFFLPPAARLWRDALSGYFRQMS